MPRLSDPITARLAVLELEQQGSTILRLDEQIANIRADLHPGQLEFVDDSQTQILGISAGYGAGKTRALCAKAVMLAVAQPRLHWCGDGAHRAIDPRHLAK
jgi:hypothetical protein